MQPTLFIERIRHLTTLILNNKWLLDNWNTAIKSPNFSSQHNLQNVCEDCKQRTHRPYGESPSGMSVRLQTRKVKSRSNLFKPSTEKCFEHNVDFHKQFIDFIQAFDSINRMTISTILRKYKIPKTCIRTVMMTLHETVSKAMIQESKSEYFRTIHIQKT